MLDGYTYDKESRRYRSTTTGRFVSRGEITGALEDVINETGARVARLAEAAQSGDLPPSVFVEQMRTELKTLHLQNAALGKGGWDQLDQADYGRLGAKLRDDYARLESFGADITELSTAEARNRAGLYVGNARTNFFEAERAAAGVTQEETVLLEIRDLGAAEHCDDCVAYRDLGWQVEGTLPVPGRDSACLTNCRCTMRRREVLISEVAEWIGTRHN